MNKFLDSLNGNDILEIRDRALFELIYGTGLRVGEVSRLDITDIDLNVGKALVRQGKWNKERIVPLGNNVIKYIKIYLEKARSDFLKIVKRSDVREALFLTLKGNRMSVTGIEYTLKKRFNKLGLDVKICPHILRHSFATHMLENGASLKHVKDILGHNSMQTTVIYTPFNVKSLKRILKMYHPRENQLYEEVDKNLLEEVKKIL